MNKSDFTSFIKSVPKAEIHLHIEAVITIAGIKKLYKKRYGKEMTKEEQTELFSYNDLNGFIQAFIKVQNMFSSVDDFNIVFDELEKYLVKENIVHCEAFFAPTAFLKMGFQYQDMIAIFHKRIAQIKEKHNITIKLIMDVSRTFGCDNAMKNYSLLKQYPCEDIIGIGLGGAESKGPAKDFAPVYDLAVKEGWKVVAHAGEDVGPESIWDALNCLHSQRIGHGITAIQDEGLMEHLKNSQIPLEVCVTSNTFTKKIVTEAKNHPIRAFFDKGLLVTVNTDDPVFFKTTMSEELWICHKELKFSMQEIQQLVINGFTAAFLSEAQKDAYINAVKDAFKSVL